MNLQLKTKNKKTHLLIVSKGTLSVKEDLFKHAELIYREIVKHTQTNILIEESETTFPQSLFDYADLVNFYREFPPDVRLLKLAAVIRADNTAKKIAEFWETACANKGFQFRAFTSMHEAEAWLLKE